MTEEREPVQVYLIGSAHRMREYCREHDVNPDGPYVHHVDKLGQLSGVDGGKAIFLRDWQTLDDGRALYNHVIARRIQPEDAT